MEEAEFDTYDYEITYTDQRGDSNTVTEMDCFDKSDAIEQVRFREEGQVIIESVDKVGTNPSGYTEKTP